MNRFVVFCSLSIAALAGCDTPPSGGKNGGLTGLDADGGVCEKDPQTIKNVMLAPPTCNATNPCPCGTFCSSQTGGNCVADCVDNSWCAPGYLCSGYGQCLAATDGGAGEGGTGPNVDPACPRNESLLDSLEVMNRSCQFDDICPFGSHCDHVKGRCYAACRSDAQCAGMNSPGHTFVCGCLGKCAEVGVPRVTPTANLPRLEITPADFTFRRPAFIDMPVWGGNGTRDVTVRVLAPFVTTVGMAITGPVVTVQANPGPGLMVRCPGGAVPSAMPCTFTVDPVTFQPVSSGGYRSGPITLTLAPSPGAPTAESWSLRLESKDVANAPQTVALRYDNVIVPPQPGQDLEPIDAPAASFRGVGEIQFRTATGAPMAVAVRGRTWNVCNGAGQCPPTLVLYDDTRQISPSGKLVVRITSEVPVFIDVGTDSDTFLNNTLSGAIPQRITSTTLFSDLATGSVKGHFTRVVYTDNYRNTNFGELEPIDLPMTTSLVLEPTTSTAGFCAQDSDCPVSGRCDLGFCSAGPPHRAPRAQDTTGELRVKWFASQLWGQALTGAGFVPMFAPSSFYALKPGVFVEIDTDAQFGAVSGEPNVTVLWTGSTPSERPRNSSLMVPLLTQMDRAQFAPTAAQLLSACLSEMTRMTVDNGLDTGATCINLGRVRGALGDRQTFQGALQGVLSVTSFVAREGLEESRLADALAGTPSGASTGVTTDAPSLQQVLGVTEGGLGLFLNAGSAQNGPYQFMSPSELWSTYDYRRPLVSGGDCGEGACPAPSAFCDAAAVCRPALLTTKPHWEQKLGAPTHALRAATSYLTTLEAYLKRTAALTFGQPADSSPASARQTALARFGTAMRMVLAVEKLAVTINIRAGVDTTNGICPGDPQDCAVIAERFNAARDELNIIRSRVVDAALTLKAATNPFNIPEDDVPLFFGDPSGASSQFFAASDYLLTGWAVPAVQQAQSLLDAARASWIQQLQSGVQDELNKHNREIELQGLMSKYGAPILANCGNLQVPDEGAGGTRRLLDSTEVIPYFSDGTKTLSNATCFVDQSCGGGPASLDKRAELRAVLNAAFAATAAEPFADGEALVAADACRMWARSALLGEPFAVAIGINCKASFCPVDQQADGNLYFNVNGRSIPLAALYGPIPRSDIGPGHFYEFAANGFQLPPPPAISAGAGDGEDAYLIAPLDEGLDDNVYRYNGDLRAPTTDSWVIAHCGDNLPEHPAPDLLPAHCYKGQMGVSFQEVRADLLRMQRAKEVLDNGLKDLDDQKGLCETVDMHILDINALREHYVGMRNAYQRVSSIVKGFEEGGKAGQEAFKSGAGYGAIAIAIIHGLRVFAMEEFGNAVKNEAEHLQHMQDQFSSEEKALQCWNTFKAQRRAMATAMTDIQIATANLFAMQIRFQNLASENDLNLQEGKAVLKQEKASPVSSLGRQFWVNERVDQFNKEFEWSRRLVYLAMRAVEFEFQQSLPFRSQIVAAATPAQLQEALIGLKQEQASRTINRRRPEEASVVLSLRDDVLAVADRTDAPTGERDWTAAERFSSRLHDDRYAYRDSRGNYLGQAIPFTLAPTGILETRCGERLWRATATIQGDGIEESAPGASVLLLKRNTFASQYCEGKAPTTDAVPQMQIGVVHTSADLFQPGSEIDLTDANLFTASLLYPWFNVRRTDFYKATYRDGASEELAGRGLYGDYVLLFPKQVLDEGFTLERVEDVLLRLDYLSVDNLSQ